MLPRSSTADMSAELSSLPRDFSISANMYLVGVSNSWLARMTRSAQVQYKVSVLLLLLSYV